jgi:hypothetical protein
MLSRSFKLWFLGLEILAVTTATRNKRENIGFASIVKRLRTLL